MKLSEVIKALEKDRSKIFVSENVKLYTTEGEYLHFNNTIVDTQIGCINLDRGWEEVVQPITFNEVMDNGKAFRCEHPKIQNDDYWGLIRFFYYLSMNYCDSAEIADILKNGKFYN